MALAYYTYTAVSKARSPVHEVIYDSSRPVDFRFDFLFIAMCYVTVSGRDSLTNAESNMMIEVAEPLTC